MTKQTTALPGQIDAIKAHLASGNQVAILTAYRIIKLTAKHVDYIRASSDGKGYRLGWIGKPSVYVFANQVAIIAPGFKI